MGRYITDSNNSDGFKFWFAVQGSDDILEWTQERECITSSAYAEELPKINEKLDSLKHKFEEQFSQTYDEFMLAIKDGYDSKRKDTEPRFNDKLRLASRIDLGMYVKKQLEVNDCVDFESEV